MRVVIGGPSYQMLLDARHAGAMGNLALALRASGACEWVQFHWGHGCPVEHARNRLFTDALKSGATHLFWADADCYWLPSDVNGVLWLLAELESQRLPFAALPTHQRNGDSNIIESREGKKWNRLRGKVTMAAELKECVAAGLGAAAFYLPWYRDNWPDAPWFRTEWRHGDMISEDFWHTNRLLTEHKVSPRWAPVVQVVHAARGVTGDDAR